MAPDGESKSFYRQYWYSRFLHRVDVPLQQLGTPKTVVPTTPPAAPQYLPGQYSKIPTNLASGIVMGNLTVVSPYGGGYFTAYPLRPKFSPPVLRRELCCGRPADFHRSETAADGNLCVWLPAAGIIFDKSVATNVMAIHSPVRKMTPAPVEFLHCTKSHRTRRM